MERSLSSGLTSPNPPRRCKVCLCYFCSGHPESAPAGSFIFGFCTCRRCLELRNVMATPIDSELADWESSSAVAEVEDDPEAPAYNRHITDGWEARYPGKKIAFVVGLRRTWSNEPKVMVHPANIEVPEVSYNFPKEVMDPLEFEDEVKLLVSTFETNLRLEAKHEDELKKLADLHQEEIRDMEERHEQVLAEMKARHNEEVESLRRNPYDD